MIGADRAICEELVQCSLCDHQDHCGLDRFAHGSWLLAHRLTTVRHRLLVLSNKGGVGKSTVAVNLAVALARRGLRVGIADADLNGPNVPHLLGLDGTRVRLGPAGLEPPTAAGFSVFSLGFMLGESDPLLVRDSLKQEFLSQLLGGVAWGELDLLIVDMPPGTGGELLALAELDPDLDGCVLVTTPHVLARADARRAVTALAETGIPLLVIVENMASLRCAHGGEDTSPFTASHGAALAAGAGVPLLGCIPLDPAATAAAERGEPVVLAAPDSAAARALEEAANALLARLDLW
jgi:ATP-binding protein involved in chromosome partitioning